MTSVINNQYLVSITTTIQVQLSLYLPEELRSTTVCAISGGAHPLSNFSHTNVTSSLSSKWSVTTSVTKTRIERPFLDNCVVVICGWADTKSPPTFLDLPMAVSVAGPDCATLLITSFLYCWSPRERETLRCPEFISYSSLNLTSVLTKKSYQHVAVR